MAMDNTVTITGNATREPELRFTPAGQPVASFGVAVNRRWQNKQTQEWEESTSFIDVTCWADLAENVAESVDRGSRITVTGRLDQRSWETQEGDKRSKVEIVADDVAISLKWATAEVKKNTRSGDSNSGSKNQSNGKNQGKSQSDNPPYDSNEEPF